MQSIVIAFFLIISGFVSAAYSQDRIVYEDTTGIISDIQSIDTLIVSGQMAEVHDKIELYKQSNLQQIHPNAYYLLLGFSTRFNLITGNFNQAEKDGKIAYQAYKDVPFDSDRNYLIGRTIALWYAYTLSEMGESQEAVQIANDILAKIEQRTPRDKRPFQTVIANVYRQLGDFDLAIESFTNMLAETENDYNKAIYNNNLGLAYHELEKYETAISHYEEAISINKKLNNVRDLAGNYNNMFNSYSEIGNKDVAVEFARKGLSLAQKEGLKSSEVRLLYNIADAHIEENRIDSAFIYLRKSLKISTELNIPEGIYFNNYGMGNAFYELNQYSQAITHYEKAYEFAKEGGRRKLAMDALEPLFTIHEIRGDFQEAFQYQKEFLELKSDLLNQERLTTIERLKIQYGVAQKNQQAEYLSQKVELQQASLTMQNRISWMLGLGFLLTGGFLAFIYQQKRKLTLSFNKIEEARKVIQLQNKALEELNTEKNTLINIVAHDIRNPLNAIMGFMNLLEEDPEMAKSEYVMKQISTSLKQTEFLVSDLTNLNYLESLEINVELSETSAKETVSFAVSTILNQARNKKIEITTDLPDFDSVYSNTKYLSRVCQNLLTNAIKFSKPGTQISISGGKTSSGFELRIKDQGPGFTEDDKKHLFTKYEQLSAKATENEPGTGLGLYIVKTICDHLNIDIELESTTGSGSTFILRIPVSV
jgi:signal transduction histidine kinase